MTLESAESDLLIILASSSVVPLAPVFSIFSLPARSTRFSWPLRVEPSSRFFCWTFIMKTLWEREETAFMLVAATCRFSSPRFSASSTSSSPPTHSSVRP